MFAPLKLEIRGADKIEVGYVIYRTVFCACVLPILPLLLPVDSNLKRQRATLIFNLTKVYI